MEKGRKSYYILAGAISTLLLFSCAQQKKIAQMQKEHTVASIALPVYQDFEGEMDEVDAKPKADTLKITDLTGKEVFLMSAIQDDDGEMVATEELQSAVITVRFRNVAERHGKVDVVFDITVPPTMQDPDWQLRFRPVLTIKEDTLALEPINITGENFRRQQLRGYQQYQRFVNKIITDTLLLVDRRNLEIFIERNLPHLYAFRNDSTFVTDEVFATCFSVTEQQAIDHYAKGWLIKRNERRKARRMDMYRRYIKVPIDNDAVKLDSVTNFSGNNFTYQYARTVDVGPDIRRMNLVLSGDIYDQDKLIYKMPDSEPLTYYVSSLAPFAEEKTMYLTEIIERRAEANSSYRIEFETAKSDILPDLADNAAQIDEIKANLRTLLENEEYILDSIRISAWASPEGSLALNTSLSHERAASAARYFEAYTREYSDSLDLTRGFSIDENGQIIREEGTKIKFISRGMGEKWDMLADLVARDTLLTDADKAFFARQMSVRDLDVRESRIRDRKMYKHLREDLYPRLRSVDFDFFLHRRGMVKDTVVTTKIDTVYALGLQKISEGKYAEACDLIGGYGDYNAAVAHTLMDHNYTALEILEPMERTAKVNYLLSILYSRTGREQQAAECYVRACEQEPSYVHRGNLDPEISIIITKYNIH